MFSGRGVATTIGAKKRDIDPRRRGFTTWLGRRVCEQEVDRKIKVS